MNTQFSDTFEDSLDNLHKHHTWWYKLYRLICKDIPNFIKNLWRFRSALWNHVWWDHHGALEFLQISLTHMSDKIEKDGIEVDESRLKKVEKMRRTAQLIKNYREGLYLEMAEKELGEMFYNEIEFEECPDRPGYFQLVDNDTPEEKEHNDKVRSRSHEIEIQEWNELFETLKGQDYTKFNKNTDWNKQFDGSGLKGWWD